jgi:anti-sigma factor RsiW
MNCPGYSERLSAMLDGELPAQEVAAVTAHLAVCPECLRYFSELAELRAQLQQAIPEAEADPEFYDKIAGLLDSERVKAAGGNVVPFRPRVRRERLAWLAAGTAVAAMLAVMLMPRHDETKDFMSVRDAALRGGISQPVAADAGPAAAGFYLASARNDIVAGHPAQVLGYVQGKQTVTLCIWPADGEPAHGKREAVYKGMTFSYWNNGKEEYWATTAAPATTLHAFLKGLSPS